MKRLTTAMMERSAKTGRPIKNWDAGARFSLSVDWDAENYVLGADEVRLALNKYLAKWPGLKKFHVRVIPKVEIEYVR